MDSKQKKNEVKREADVPKTPAAKPRLKILSIDKLEKRIAPGNPFNGKH